MHMFALEPLAVLANLQHLSHRDFKKSRFSIDKSRAVAAMLQKLGYFL